MGKKRNKLGQILQRVLTQEKFNAGRDLAEFRQTYYALSVAERQRFKKNMQALVAACKPFEGTRITFTAEQKETWHSHDGDSISVTAKRTPAEILKAIDEWDHADEQTPASGFSL